MWGMKRNAAHQTPVDLAHLGCPLTPPSVMAPQHKSQPCCDMAADSHAAESDQPPNIQEMVLGRMSGVCRYASQWPVTIQMHSNDDFDSPHQVRIMMMMMMMMMMLLLSSDVDRSAVVTNLCLSI